MDFGPLTVFFEAGINGWAKAVINAINAKQRAIKTNKCLSLDLDCVSSLKALRNLTLVKYTVLNVLK